LPETPTSEVEDQHDDPAEIQAKLAGMSREQLKARVLSVLDRGIVNDRLFVKLPNNLYGEWVKNDPLEVDRLRTLGFWLDEEFSTKRAIHADGSKGNKVGDVIFMVTTKDNKEIIDEARREISARADRKVEREERELQNNIRNATQGDIPAFVDSSVRPVGIADVLQKMNEQTQVQK
jgi:hypothetical protein